MNKLRVTFNGQLLSNYLSVVDGLHIPMTGDRNYTVINGEVYDLEKGPKKITLPFYIKGDIFVKRDIINTILNVREPKRLEFGYEPNRYYMAIPEGDINFVAKDDIATGTITFRILDGVSKSKTITPFTFAKQADGSWKTKIVNNGSEWAYVNYNIDIARETGYIGLVSEHGILQFGKVDEADMEQATKSVRLLTNKGGDFTNWQDASVFYENQAKVVATTMTGRQDFGGWIGVLPSHFSHFASTGSWFGAAKEYIFDEPVKDWYLWARAWFETGKMGQTGGWALCAIDENNQLIAGMLLEKYDRSGNKAELRFTVGSEGVKTVIPFTPHFWIDRGDGNAYGSQSRDQNRNMFDMKKCGDTITFYYYGKYYNYIQSRLADKKAKRLQFMVYQMAGRNTTDNEFVTHHYLSDLSFTKLNVPYWRDVPNRYPSGTKLKIDGQQGKLYVNNKVAEKDEIKGSKYFLVPPGETEIILTTSSFGEIKSATAEIVERWV